MKSGTVFTAGGGYLIEPASSGGSFSRILRFGSGRIGLSE